ncbi:DNA topoisomerase III [Salibacterium halotolerans]|uniref:DNA topoisomerase 3 n=1 Tax=Salibacterium halotolerans TaxID=1884432 RepID=A0A1I5RP57_9BACI|nr:DNA topoisomerase III [Salibacterium halotolerans]SFP59716.1 DNA topoisomerase-3 [Salibacterium halotolerans]
MSKSVILAEKPSVGKDIARVLGCRNEKNGVIEGSRYIVTWAFGHLVTLAEPDTYDANYKTWRLEDLPMLPEKLKLSVINKSGKQFNTVKKQLSRDDVSEVIIATDAGREGELVARWILDKANAKKKIKRLWISSVTDQAIKQGFQKLHDGRKFNSLYAAAQARAEADWYVGMNATRALTTKFNASLSCGRVQTPTLAMVASREQEIKEFKPDTFYQLYGKTERGPVFWWKHPKSGDTRLFSKEKAEQLDQKVKNKPAVVTSVERKEKKNDAPLLYDLTELQRECSQRFGYSAKETLSVLQRLYETHKVLTYPRTDSNYLSSDLKGTMKERLKAVDVRPFSRHVLTINKNGWKMAGRMFNDNKVSDHHAIIPTEEAPVYQNMSDKEKKLYEMVVTRFLAAFFPPQKKEMTDLQAEIGGEPFAAKGEKVLETGWKAVYDSEENEGKNSIPSGVKEQDTLNLVKSGLDKGETKPPSALTESALLSAMENPAKFMQGEDKELVQTIKQSGGIGTVATRADIIDKLQNSFLLEKRGNAFHVTSKGKQLLDLVPEELKSATLTAEWEKQLHDIEKDNLNKKEFIDQMKSYTGEIVDGIKKSSQSFKHDNVTGTPCPECGKLMLEVKNKNGKMKVCQDRSCGYKRNIAKTTNARCPNCKKKMELRGEGDGKIFVCRCGYKEKESSFVERRNKEKQDKASKQDVKKYLNNQEDDNISNPALAEALQKWKNKE